MFYGEMLSCTCLLIWSLIVVLASCTTHTKNPKIVGGVNATDSEFPYLVSLQMNPIFGNRYHYCGGFIFNESHVITAAHCVEGRLISQIQVVAGAHVIQANSSESSEQRRSVATATIHPQFNMDTLKNDIALLRVNQTLQFNPRVRSIPIATLSTTFVGNCTTAGWKSQATPTGPSTEPEILQKVNITLVRLPECQSTYEAFHNVDDTMICGVGSKEDAMQGPCSGDNGGPLLCKDASNNDTVAAGVMSWSMIPCGNSDYPAIYTNISKVIGELFSNSGFVHT